MEMPFGAPEPSTLEGMELIEMGISRLLNLNSQLNLESLHSQPSLVFEIELLGTDEFTFDYNPTYSLLLREEKPWFCVNLALRCCQQRS